VNLAGKHGRATLRDGELRVISGENPLEIFGTEPYVLRAVEVPGGAAERRRLRFIRSFDRRLRIISFDDQVGAHGSPAAIQGILSFISPERLGLAAGIARGCPRHSPHGPGALRRAHAENAPPSAARLTPAVRAPAVESSLVSRALLSGTADRILFGRYASLVGAPNCAPSLRSVAGPPPRARFAKRPTRTLSRSL